MLYVHTVMQPPVKTDRAVKHVVGTRIVNMESEKEGWGASLAFTCSHPQSDISTSHHTSHVRYRGGGGGGGGGGGSFIGTITPVGWTISRRRRDQNICRQTCLRLLRKHVDLLFPLASSIPQHNDHAKKTSMRWERRLRFKHCYHTHHLLTSKISRPRQSQALDVLSNVSLYQAHAVSPIHYLAVERRPAESIDLTEEQE